MRSPLQRRILAILDGTDPEVGRRVAFFLDAMIVLTAVAVALETVPALAPWQSLFIGFEVVAVGVFAVEYALRLWCAPSRRGYALSAGGIIDLLAFLPSLLIFSAETHAIRILRLVRLLRLLKLTRSSQALNRFGRALGMIRGELTVFASLALLVLYLSAVGIYIFEHEAQPEQFGSIPESVWWALVTLTTVGYGDAYPITVGGRIFTSFVLIIGLAVIAIPTGLIASALVAEQKRDHDAPGPDA